MAQLKNIKRWFWWHRWTSLICTLFLLLLCLTGLPLIFGEEIDKLLDKDPPYAVLPKETPMANLDGMVNASKRLYPKQLVTYLFLDDEEPQVLVGMAPTMKPDDKLEHSMQFDARTAKLLKDELPFTQQPQTFMGLMLSLHIDLFMELPGELFLGLMGVLFVISMISGIVLYAPFMKKLDFGTLRQDRSRRLKWLDLHNLLGIATAVWLLVVGITGVINELSTPLFGLWQITDVKTMLDKYHGQPTPKQQELTSVQDAHDIAKKAVPGMIITSVIYPGNTFGSPYHYLFWAHGNTPLTSRLFSPVLVDARTGKLTAVVKMPFYLRALEVSRPLHFGDYGGMPLKILWALFDVVAIVVLVSGIYLWFDRRKLYATYFKNMETNQEINA
ncbi:PepSY-associated TM helix domain-containing protein [Mucilaginibacter sabulilitoris]|uniref:PepSY-associated TM helix domain-containing protein n=1 Tax=Mucilaginibacter sabulilitoris TaxID=1173583 RepID=A0ABZ0TK72_9SPHI|nr:PepSY-associated TM helix domain-containing protein [Mucilaginibacter sabulilitoris]WPU93211.1 PepSY-associated TM helix domain-containing protein [Mucilaginibacter sabulilitoris]